MSITYVEKQSLSTATCYACGILFAMPEDYKRRRLKDHKDFYCPSGHAQHYIGETEEARLKRELESAKHQLDMATNDVCRVRNERDAIARAHRKMRVRVANGVCPCCNRSFENLRNHMRTQHPEFGSPQTLRALRTAFGMTQAQVAREAAVTMTDVSNFERNTAVSARVNQRLHAWMDSQTTT